MILDSNIILDDYDVKIDALIPNVMQALRECACDESEVYRFGQEIIEQLKGPFVAYPIFQWSAWTLLENVTTSISLRDRRRVMNLIINQVSNDIIEEINCLDNELDEIAHEQHMIDKIENDEWILKRLRELEAQRLSGVEINEQEYDGLILDLYGYNSYENVDEGANDTLTAPTAYL